MFEPMSVGRALYKNLMQRGICLVCDSVIAFFDQKGRRMGFKYK